MYNAPVRLGSIGRLRDFARIRHFAAPRMMSVGLHLRIIGRPGRIAGLEQFLQHATSRPGVWLARRDEIAHAWRAGIALPPWTPADAQADRRQHAVKHGGPFPARSAVTAAYQFSRMLL
jgi:hypothetical protein